MSAMNGNKAIDLLFGVAGGDKLDQGSGQLIKKSIDGIVKNLHDGKHTELKFTADSESLKKLRQSIEDTLKDIKVTVKLDKDIDTSSSGGSGSSGAGSKKKTKNDLSESARVNKLIKQYKIYYEWLTRAATTVPGDGAKQRAYFEASEAALKRATEMERQYRLEGEALARFEEERAEMQRRFNVQSEAFVGGLFDKDAIKKTRDELKETVDLYKYAHKLQLAAVKESRGDDSKYSASEDALAAQRAAEEARNKYQLYGERGVEIDKLLTAQKKELAHAINIQAAAEQDAAAKQENSNLQKRAADLDKVAAAYQRVIEAQTRKSLAHTQKDSDKADQDIAKALQTAEKLRKSVGLSQTEWAELRAILKAQGIDLQSAHQSLVKYTSASAAAADRVKEAEKRSNAERQNSIATLRQLHKAIEQFDVLANKQSTINIVDETQLAGFSAKVEEIKQKLVALGLNASKADIDMEKLAQVENLDELLFDVTSLTQGLRNLQAQTGGAAIANMKLETSYHKLANRAYDYMARVQSSLSRDPAMMQEMQHLIDRLHQGDFGSVAEGAQAFQKLQFRIKQAGLEAETLGQQVKRVFKEKFGFGVMATAALYARRAISDAYKTVVELDTKLTELKIVSGATGETMVRYFDDAAAAAKRVAASITDIIDATTVYRRLGFEMSKSLDFAELTTMYSKVGNVDMSAAEDSVTSIIKAFDLNDVDQVRLAMDQLVLVGNNFAVSSSQLGEGLQNAGAALMAAGNTFTESLALLTASNNTLQDISKASTAMRTISARLRQSSAELEEIGDEGLAEEYNTTSKYRAKLMAITGVDILENDLKTFRSTYEILKDISNVWEQLEDIDQAAVTEMLGGVRNQSQIASIMATFDDAEKIMADTANAAGSMQSAYENYIDSIQGRLNTLTASSQELFNNLLDSDLIKGGVSAVTALVEALNWFIETIGLLPTVGAGVGIAKLISSVGAFKNEVQGAIALLDGLSEVEDVTAILQTYDYTVAQVAISQAKLAESDRMQVLSNLEKIKTQNLIHKNNIQDIVDMAKLDAAKSLELKTRLNNAVAEEIEEKVLDTLTRTQLEEILNTTEITVAKRQEILARYDNAAAAKAEGASVTNLTSTAKIAGAGIKSVGESLLAFVGKHPVVAVLGGIAAAFMAYKKINEWYLKSLQDNADETREAYSSLSSEIDSISDKLTDVRSRIKEISKIGSPTLVDKQELAKLKEQNEELERELRIKQKLAKMADLEAEESAFKLLDAQKYKIRERESALAELDLSQHSGEWYAYLSQKMDDYATSQRELTAAQKEYQRLLDEGGNDFLSKSDRAGADRLVKHLEKQLESQATAIRDTYDWLLTNVVASIGDSAESPEAKEFLGLWEKFLDEYDRMLDNVDGSRVAEKFIEKFDQSLTHFMDTSVYGGNVDLTIRPQVDSKSMRDAGWDIEDGGIATVYSSTYSSEDGTRAILVTPILPNGEVLTPDALDKYVGGLLEGGEDTYGITLGVFEGQNAIQQADLLGQQVHNAQAEWDAFIDLLVAGGDISDRTAESLKLVANTVLQTSSNAEVAAENIGDLSASLTAITGKYDLLKEAQDQYKESNVLAADTLASIVEAYPALSENVSLYLVGLKSAKSLLADLSDAYKVDRENYFTSIKAKLEVNAEFCSSLTEEQKKLIDDLADAYGVDLTNFKTVEQLKVQFQSTALKTLTLNWSRYAGMNLEQLKAEYELIAKSEALFAEKERATLWQAIRSWEEMLAKLDEVIYDDTVEAKWDPAKYASSSIKDAEDAFEKFKAKWEDWFSDMEFKVNLKYEAGDLDGANKLYQQMVDKAQELLNDAYAEGMTIDDEWVQDLITKVNTYKKALADLRIEEYDKLIEYNDQFDVWNHVSYTKLDKLKEKLEAINEQYIAGLRSYQDWYDAFTSTAGDIYEIQKEGLDELLDAQMDAIKTQTEAHIDSIEAQRDAQVEALEDQLDAMDEIIERRKQMLEDARDEASYEKEVAKRVKEIAKLQERISQLSLDNSREATAERMALEEQLSELQEELADYQSSYATDATIAALDEQKKLYEDSIDEKIDAVEDAADSELKILQSQLNDEVALRRKAIAQIDNDYQLMLDDIVGYFRSLGYEIDESLIEKLREGLNLVAQFGSYNGASDGISTNVGGLGSSSIASLVRQMKDNAAKWWEVKTPGSKGNEQNAAQLQLSAQNERIADMLKQMGLDIWKSNGQWFIRINGTAMPLFDYFGGVYHNGGVVGGASTPKSDELFALLKKGEVVLNEDQQSSMLNIFNNAGRWMQNQMAQTMGVIMRDAYSHSAAADSGSRVGTFAPNIEVNISHNGNMSDADARRYGNQIADVALDKLYSTLQKRGIT